MSALLGLVLVTAACTGSAGDDGPNGSSTTAGNPNVTTSSTSSTSSTDVSDNGNGSVGSTGTTTTTSGPARPIPGPELGVLVTLDDRIEIRPAEGPATSVLGDESRSLRIAFDDLNSGLVYQYLRTPPDFGPDAVLHLPAGASEPIELLTAGAGETIELVDVSLLNGVVIVLVAVDRPPDSALLTLPLAGGAPSEVLTIGQGRVEPPADNGFLYRSVVGGAVGGDLVAHLIASDGDCRFPEARRSDERFVVDPLISACDYGTATLVDLDRDGLLLGYVVEEDDTAFIRGIDLDRLAPTGQPTIPSGGRFLDIADDTALVTYADGYLVTDFSGTRLEDLEGDVQAVTALRSVPQLAVDAFLGGFRTPSACSGFDVSPIRDQAGLPPAVLEKRSAIAMAIRDCDFLSLRDLMGPSFTASFGGGEALDLWAAEELRGLTPLADIARTLALPFALIEGAESDIYVWPSAFGEDPSESDWQALEALYNEEEIELWRNGGFTGLRVGITARGTWIYAVAGD